MRTQQWRARQHTGAGPASADGRARPPGTASYEAPTEEEFFLPGSGAALGMSSADLEASRTATWDDNMATIDEVEPPGELVMARWRV